MNASRRCVVLLAALAGCSPYVYLDELPDQPTDAVLGRWVVLEASAGTSTGKQVRVRVDGGRMRSVNAEEFTEGPLCWSVADDDIDTLLNVTPDNVELVVTAELAKDGDCATAESTGPAAVLVVRGPSTSITGSGGGGGGATGSGGSSPDT